MAKRGNQDTPDTTDGDAIAQTEDIPAILTDAPDDWEFETVVERSAIIVDFTQIGDRFIGQYKGLEHIVPSNGVDEPFDRALFRGRDGELYAVNPTFKLQQAIDESKLNEDDWARLTYVADIPTKRGLNPMKDITVEIKRN